ncbi:MAG: isoprenylcysteine carboxylmethyltransferase family protein [Chloroflexi bacterium]|nr:isoprenylcysteine carboxylmethyltransferase family protein [Chloroflexota bacterium]
MTWEFWTFLSITSVRQAPQFWLELRSRGVRILHSSGSRSTLAMFVLYLAIWITTLVYLAFSDPRPAPVIAGGCLLVLGTGMRFAALGQLGAGYSGAIIIREGHRLTRSGVYRLVRHPLHLALVTELLGMMVYTEAWWLAPLWAVLGGTILARNRTEDRVLREVFGEEAVGYQASTPGMNPLAHLYRRGS